MQDYKNFRAGLLALGIGASIAVSAPAAAQYGAMNTGVTVDLSVIDDGGMAAVEQSRALPNAPSTGLIMPGSQMPSSAFIAPPSAADAPRITLKKPDEMEADNGSSFMAPPPLKKPAPTVAARAVAPVETPPAPKLAPSPKIAEPVAPKPQPKPAPVEMAAKAPEPVKAAPVEEKAKPLEPPAPPAVKKPPVTSEEVPPPPQVAKLEAPNAPMPLTEPAAKSEPVKPPVQVAAIAPKAPVETGDTQQVPFSGETSKLPASAKPVLDKLAAEINDSTEKRLQVLAYAGGDNLSSSKARRLSLSRALAIRSYMIGQGVKSTRIDVRALGDKVPDGDPNRVDLKVVTR